MVNIFHRATEILDNCIDCALSLSGLIDLENIWWLQNTAGSDEYFTDTARLGKTSHNETSVAQLGSSIKTF